MQVALHVAKVWATFTFGALAVLGALGGAFALVDHDWRDRLTGGVEDLTVTVTGQHRNEFGCGTKYETPGWDWEVTWTDAGKIRTGTIEKCAEAPEAGTEVDTHITSDGTLGGESTHGYFVWWLVLSAGFGSLFAWVHLVGRGKPALQELRAEAA